MMLERMQSFFITVGISLFIIVLLYTSQETDPPARIAYFISDLPPKASGRCDVTNLETLRHAAIVYTWINDTEKCYQERCKRAGLPTTGRRDTDKNGLKYSLRSLLKFAPWLQGPIYIVTPGQIPDWLNVWNSRVHVVDQDELLPKDKVILPNFNMNVIEQYLYKIPGLTDVFIHMTDENLFIKPVTPNRLFTCNGGLKLLTETRPIDRILSPNVHPWVNSVHNTIMLTDKTYGGEHVHNYVKHAPVVYSRLAMEQLHKKFATELDAMLLHQTHHIDDLNIPQLHHIYMQEEGSKALGIPVGLNSISESKEWRAKLVADKNNALLNEMFNLALENKGPEILLTLLDSNASSETAELLARFYSQMLPEATFFELPEGQHVSVVSNWHGVDCAYDPDVIPLPDFVSVNAKEGAVDWTRTPAPTRFRSSNELAFSEMKLSFGWNLASNIGYAFGLIIPIVAYVYVSQFSSKVVPRRRTTKQT